jgi:hypothetical protein
MKTIGVMVTAFASAGAANGCGQGETAGPSPLKGFQVVETTIDDIHAAMTSGKVTRTRSIQHFARSAGRVRLAQPAACGRGAAERAARSRGRAGRRRAAQGRPGDRDGGRANPRAGTTLEALGKLKPLLHGGTVTPGNASGVNDGAAALIVASEAAASRHGLTPITRVLGGATAGVSPRIMGIGPAPASRLLCARLGLTPKHFDVIELNEAFASQGIAVLRALGIPEDAPHVNPNGGAIALGHPLGMSGARLAGTAALELKFSGKRWALATMCVGVGQGSAMALERV